MKGRNNRGREEAGGWRQGALSPWPSRKSEKKVHGQIHLPLLQSISGQKKYTITRQEEAKINGPPTSPLTSIHLHPYTSLFPSDALFRSPASFTSPCFLTFALRKKLLFYTFCSPPSLPRLYPHPVSATCSNLLFLLTVLRAIESFNESNQQLQCMQEQTKLGMFTDSPVQERFSFFYQDSGDSFGAILLFIFTHFMTIVHSKCLYHIMKTNVMWDGADQ